MNPERLSGYDSQWERSLQLFPFRATAAHPHVVHRLDCDVNETPHYFSKLTGSRCLIDGSLFWPIDVLRQYPVNTWAGRTASFPPGNMWPQIKIIKQETSLVLPYVQASSTGASWDYPVNLEWPKHPIIMPCQNKQLLSHHFLKLITQNMQQLPSFSHESSSCPSLRLYIWYTLRAETFQLHAEPIIIFSYGDFGDCVLPAGCLYFMADFSHASLIDIWSTLVVDISGVWASFYLPFRP